MPIKAPVRALPAAPPLISLLSSAVEITEQDARWEAGLSYESEFCGFDRTGAFAACAVSRDDPDPGIISFSFDPIIAWATDSCSSLGSANRDWQGRVLRKLAACESAIIEREFWRGDIARDQSFDNRYLASAEAEIVSASPSHPVDVLACLEDKIAHCNCGGRGMIHATPQLVTYWAAERLVSREGNTIVSTLGTLIVPGAGYDGSGPGLSPGDEPIDATNSSWAYATSMVHFRRGPATVTPTDPADALDRRSNKYVFWAQRTIEVGWDCCLFAAEADITPCAVVS